MKNGNQNFSGIPKNQKAFLIFFNDQSSTFHSISHFVGPSIGLPVRWSVGPFVGLLVTVCEEHSTYGDRHCSYKNILFGSKAWKEVEIATSKITTAFLNFGQTWVLAFL